MQHKIFGNFNHIIGHRRCDTERPPVMPKRRKPAFIFGDGVYLTMSKSATGPMGPLTAFVMANTQTHTQDHKRQEPLVSSLTTLLQPHVVGFLLWKR